MIIYPIWTSGTKNVTQYWKRFFPTSSRFVGFARHACDGLGFLYPTPDEIDMKEYIENLKVPGDKRMHYDDIFNRAIARVYSKCGFT